MILFGINLKLFNIWNVYSEALIKHEHSSKNVHFFKSPLSFYSSDLTWSK